MMDAVDMPDIRPRMDGLYEVSRDWTVRVSVDDVPHVLTVAAGFVFDGASIPRILWRVCGSPFDAPRVAAALGHDWLYSSQATDRRTADRIYLNLQKRLGISSSARYVEYYALRMFGDSAWSEKTKFDREYAFEHGSLTKEST